MINGTETKWSFSFDNNEGASAFIRQCSDNGISIAGIEHGTHMTVYFWTEADLIAAQVIR